MSLPLRKGLMKLTKDGAIHLTILGSGTCVPSLSRSACSVFLKTNGQNILIDAGPGTMRRLLEAGISIFDIDFFFLSHFHPDHCAEMVPFLFANRYPDMGKRGKKLTLCGGPGFSSFFNGLNEIFNKWIELPGMLETMELTPGRYAFKGFELEAAAVNHRPESLAFRVTSQSKATVVYSGDTDFSENLIGLSKNADILICESALPDGIKVAGHMTPGLAGKTATAAKVKHLVLTHFYPECDNVDIKAQCRKTYAGPLTLAEDLMTLTVG
ncbi:MAG: ribonuclease Z [Deltaproteobacteria bacterium]|nr:ribonuclease Z [Deltaproteobacteria bacterium]